MFKGIAEATLGDAVASSVSWAYGLTLIIIPTIFYILVFLFYSRKQKIMNVEIQKPVPLDSMQKKTLGLILVIMVLVIIPVFAQYVCTQSGDGVVCVKVQYQGAVYDRYCFLLCMEAC